MISPSRHAPLRGKRSHFAWLLPVLALLLSGCAHFSEDAGMGMVTSSSAADLGKDVVKITDPATAREVHTRVAAILARRLGADDAVQVALLNNAGLQAAFAELEAMEAQSVEASLPPSPTLSLARFVATGKLELERQILQSILGLATLPRRREIARARFRQAQLKAVEAVLKLAADTRRAYYRAVAASAGVSFLEKARKSAEATSEIARRLGESGALNKLDQAREHAFTADLGGQLASARLKVRVERERLTRLMGLWGKDTGYRLPDQLPKLPARPKTLPDVEREAIERRIDLQIARADLDILARQLGLTERTRFVNVLELRGVDRIEKSKTLVDGGPEVDVEKSHWRGLEVEFQIPLFDFGRARVRNAEALYMLAVHRLAERAVNIRSEVREAYQSYRGTYDIARHYQREVLPLRKAISEETLLRYNAMVSDLFQLLVDARAQIASNSAALDALRDHWLAATDLQVSIIGGGVSGASVGGGMAAMADNSGGGH